MYVLYGHCYGSFVSGHLCMCCMVTVMVDLYLVTCVCVVWSLLWLLCIRSLVYVLYGHCYGCFVSGHLCMCCMVTVMVALYQVTCVCVVWSLLW